MEGGLVGETRSSRQACRGSNVSGAFVDVEGVPSSFGVMEMGELWSGFGLRGATTDWKAWIGRASKNSWAIVKGVLLGSVVVSFGISSFESMPYLSE